jgi:outer membrane protein, heavy metal efflux system
MLGGGMARFARTALLWGAAILGPATPVWAAATDAAAATGWLTIEDAVRLFRERGFDLLLADLAVQRAQGEQTQAGAVANPQFSGGVGRSFTYHPSQCATPGCSAIAWNAGLSEQGAVFDLMSGKRGLRLRSAQAALAATRADRLDVQRTLELEVRRQYLEAVYAGDALALAMAVAASYSRTLDLNRVRLQAGAISEVEVLRVEVAALETRQDMNRAAQAAEQARAQLAFLIGYRRPVDFRVAPSLPPFAVPPPLEKLDGASDALLTRALDHRPDVAAARRQRDRAAAQLAVARRLRFPAITLAVLGTGQGTGQSAITPPTLTFNLTLTPPLLYQYQGEIAAAHADLSSGDVTLARVEANVRFEVAAALIDLGHARQRVERMEGQLLDLARRSRDLVRFQYEKGAASLLEYLDAERTYFTDSQEHLRDLADYWIAVHALEAAVGQELRR